MEYSEISDAHVLSVESSYRIRIPQPLCKRVGWITGNSPLKAWLLLGSQGRCRVLPESQAETDPDLIQLRSNAVDSRNETCSTVQFQRDALTALPLRLAQIEVRQHETSGWRFILPRHIAAIMQLTPGKSDIIALLTNGHLELWTTDTLRTAVDVPLTEIT